MVNAVREKPFYGWFVVAGTWMAYFLLTVPTTYGGSIVTTHIVLKYGWDESVIGIVDSVKYASLAAFSIPVGFIVRRKGCKFAYKMAILIGALGYLPLCLIQATVPIYIFLFITAGISMAHGGLVTAPIMISSWFERRKALPMAITMTAGSIGGFLMPPVTEAILSACGEVVCWRIFFLLEVITLVPVLLLMRNTPEEVGEIQDGRRWRRDHPEISGNESLAVEREELSLAEAYRSKEFIVICTEYTVFRMAFAAFMAYAVLFAIQRGMSAASAAVIISLANILSFVGRTMVSFTDRWKISLKIWCILSFMVLAGGNLLYAAAWQPVLFYLAAALFGLSTGFMTTLFPILLPGYCGNTNFSVLYGTMSMVGYAGGIVAPLLVALVFRISGGYDKAFLGIMLLSIGCAAISLLLRKISVKSS